MNCGVCDGEVYCHRGTVFKEEHTLGQVRQSGFRSFGFRVEKRVYGCACLRLINNTSVVEQCSSLLITTSTT